MDLDDENTEISSKYAHLLQPIRDLAENWNIDVASELEEYLTDLEKISFSFEDGKRLNFAEAALLIQGSACIYSKKVEFLYQLVFQVLDYLAEKRKRKPHNTSVNAEGVDRDIEVDDEPEFLTLDDIEEAEGIDLVEDNVSSKKRGDINLTNASTLALLINRQNTEDQSGIGSRRTDFRMNTALLHKSGALLLEDKDKNDIDETFHRVGTGSVPGSASRPTRLIPTISVTPGEGNVTGNQANNSRVVFEGVDAGGFDSDDDGPGVNEPIMATTDGQTQVTDRARQAANGSPTRSPVDQTQALPRRTQRSRRSKKTDDDDELGAYHWKLLDPHEPGNVKQKPFKKGKTYRIPENLKPKKKGKEDNEQPESEASTEKTEESDKTKNTTRSLVMKGSFWPEFDYIYEKVMKKRQQERRRFKEDILARSFMSASNVSIAAIAAQTQIDEEEEQEAYHAYAPIDFGGQDDDDDDNVAPEPIALDVHFEDSNVTGQSYEELCRSHVEQYLANAQNFVQETTLGLRIAEWNKRILPVLEEQDARPSFDIRQYGERIMTDRFASKEGHEISCNDLMGRNSVPAYEVCRNFVAVLQLANLGNIEIIPTAKVMNAVSFKLLTTRPAYDIENYRVPSIFEPEESQPENRSQKRTKERQPKEDSDREEEQPSEDEPLVKKSKGKLKGTSKTKGKKGSKGSRAREHDKENAVNFANVPAEIAV